MLSKSRDEHFDVRMQPVLAYVRKLTLSPEEVTKEDVDPIFAATGTIVPCMDAAAICGLFNLMNRVVNGLGVEALQSYTKLAAQRLAQKGYAQLIEFLSASK